MTLFASHCHSLKEKRSVVRRVKDRVHNKFGVPLAEVGGQDTWQRAVVGFALVSSDRHYVDATLRKITSFIDTTGLVSLGDVESETLVYGDEPFSDGSRFNLESP